MWRTGQALDRSKASSAPCPRLSSRQLPPIVAASGLLARSQPSMRRDHPSIARNRWRPSDSRPPSPVWFLGFMVIGCEWFAMWQSARWNGQAAATRFLICIGVTLLLLVHEE